MWHENVMTRTCAMLLCDEIVMCCRPEGQRVSNLINPDRSSSSNQMTRPGRPYPKRLRRRAKNQIWQLHFHHLFIRCYTHVWRPIDRLELLIVLLVTSKQRPDNLNICCLTGISLYVAKAHCCLRQKAKTGVPSTRGLAAKELGAACFFWLPSWNYLKRRYFG